MPSFEAFQKGLEIFFSTTFCASLFKKNISNVKSYRLTNFHSLIVFNSWDIGQYRISSNKRPRRLLNFETVRYGAY